ncbi:hypothetical protein ACFE04_003057 [Oxalis oulophora]
MKKDDKKRPSANYTQRVQKLNSHPIQSWMKLKEKGLGETKKKIEAGNLTLKMKEEEEDISKRKGKIKRFAFGIKADFSLSFINSKLEVEVPLARYIEAIKDDEEEEPVDFGSGWELQTVADLDHPGFRKQEGDEPIKTSFAWPATILMLFMYHLPYAAMRTAYYALLLLFNKQQEEKAQVIQTLLFVADPAERNNVRNQREGLVLLLANNHIRLHPRPEPLNKLDDRAVDKVMSKVRNEDDLKSCVEMKAQLCNRQQIAEKAYPSCEGVPCQQFDTAFESYWFVFVFVHLFLITRASISDSDTMNIMDSNVHMRNFALGTDVSVTTQYGSMHSKTSDTSLRRKKGKSFQGNTSKENFSNNVSQIRNNFDVGMNTCLIRRIILDVF